MSKSVTNKALILGVGNAQVDAILHLKSIGWYVIGCSYKEEGPGLGLVDKFSLTNIIDIEAVKELAQKEKVQFVYSVGSDLAMPTVAEVSQRLGLPSFSPPEQIDLLVNKGKLRQRLREYKICPIRFQMIKSKADIIGWNTFPAILKPVDSQGSRGVYFVKNINEINKNYQEAIRFSKIGTAIVEEYLDGPEIEATVLVSNGRIVINIISDRLTVAEYNTGIPEGHRTPSQLCKDDDLTITNDLIRRSVEAFNIENGPLYFQFRITSQGPKILEIGPRLDGGHIWLLIKHYCDVDVLDLTFRVLLNEALPEIIPKPKYKFTQLEFSLLPPGEAYNSSKIKPPTNCLVHQPYYSDGEIVSRVNGVLEKTGYWIWGEH